MSLDDLKSELPHSDSSLSPQKTRSYAWILPVVLILGFLIVLILLFGKRLLPAVSVNTAPVITIRADEELLITNRLPSEKFITNNKGSLLFQASGWVEPDPYTVFVPTLMNGVVDQVFVLEGQTVKKGQLLSTLDSDSAKLDLKTAQQRYSAFEKSILAHCKEYDIIDAEITAAQSQISAMDAQLRQAKDNSDRLSKIKKGNVSELSVTSAILATEMQAAMLAEAQAEVPRLKARKALIAAQKETMDVSLSELATDRDRAQLALDRTKIKASMNGIVLKLHAAPGMKRMLDMDSPTSAVIVELYNPEKLQARIDVPLNEASALTVGQSVELISDLLPNKTFTGTVSRISGQADLQRNTLQAKVQINNPDPRLRPDMLMRAKFYSVGNPPDDVAQSDNNRLAIYVPQEALINDTSVWVVTTENTAEKRSIKLGKQIKKNHQLVLQGLLSGESVILPPHGELKSGTKLNITH